MKESSFNIARFLVAPGRKIYGVLVEADLAAGILKEIAELALRHHVLIPMLHYSSTEDGVVGLGFVDLTGSDASPEKLAERLRCIKGVRNVQIIHPTVEGFAVHHLSARLMASGERAVIMRKPGYMGLIAGVREQFGEAGEAFLYQVGFEAGLRYGRAHRELAAKLSITDPIEVLCKITGPLCPSFGLGLFEVVEANLNPPEAIIRIHDSFECELIAGAKRPYSQLLRGMIAGIHTELFGRVMEAKEQKCIAKGDPYCEFKVTPE